MTSLEDLYKIFLQNPVVSTDTRKIEPGTIFFALKGTNFNGNLFALDSLKKGASYAVIDDSKISGNDKLILVDDVLRTLQQLARLHRKKIGIPVLAITGTNGKTTTKELVSAVVAKKYNLLFTQGNLNNHIGVPLTLLNLNSDHQWAVIEMGASKQGDIKELCDIADPDVALITNCGNAHLEGFGSPEGVVKTKTELYEYVAGKNGMILYNGQDEVLKKQLARWPDVKKYSYGTDINDFCFGQIIEADPFVKLRIKDPSEEYEVRSHLAGSYNFHNIMAAVCAGKFVGLNLYRIREAIESYEPSNKRSQITKTATNTLMVDCYNANPTSMRAAIESFLAISFKGRRVLILGDMLELGSYSDSEHAAIVSLLKSKKNIEVMLVGQAFSKNASGLRSFSNSDDLIAFLKSNPVQNSLVLLKGSRGIKVEKALDFL